MDRGPHLRDIWGAMWIRPTRLMLARMPSMRPPPTPPAPAGGKRKPSEGPSKPAAPEPQPPLSEEDEKKRAGGFHESSYELRTGMDVFESEWPDDVTIPGALDDD